MASHTGLPRQPPHLGRRSVGGIMHALGTQSLSLYTHCRSGPPRPWKACGGAANPEYIPPSCINDCNVRLVAQLYLPPLDSIFGIVPISTN